MHERGTVEVGTLISEVAELRDLGIADDLGAARERVEARVANSLGTRRVRRRRAFGGRPMVFVLATGLTLGAATATAVSIGVGEESIPALKNSLTRVPPSARRAITKAAAANGTVLSPSGHVVRSATNPIDLTKVVGISTQEGTGALGIGRAKDRRSWTCFQMIPGGGGCLLTSKIAHGVLPGQVRQRGDNFALTLIVGEGSRHVQLIGRNGSVIRVPVRNGVVAGTYPRDQIQELTWQGPDGRPHRRALLSGF